MDGRWLSTRAPHPDPGDFSGVFLVELLLFGAVALIYVFYFNRIFAWIVSLAIRSVSKRYFHVHISIEALQISVLGGRVFFKGFRYHGQNETILVIDGFVTWRYWLRKVRKSDLDICKETTKTSDKDEPTTLPSPHIRNSKMQNGDGARVTRHELPCRILLEVRGLEWYIYNRSPAYDAILAELSKSEGTKDADSSFARSHGATNVNEKAGLSQNNSHPTQLEENRKSPEIDEPSESLHKETDSGKTSLAEVPERESVNDAGDKEDLPRWLCLLPIGIECEKGAIVLGNENTKCVLVTRFDRAKGKVDASASRELDLYRQDFEFDAEHLLMQLRPNKDYIESHLAHGARGTSPVKVREASKSRKGHAPRSKSKWQNYRQKWLYRVPLFGRSSNSVLLDSVHGTKGTKPTESPWQRRENQVWHGLSRYLDDEDEVLVEQERWKAIEYAASQTLVDFPIATMNLHWDVPGRMDLRHESRSNFVAEREGNINGAIPPDWEITFRVGGGTINYGPWADRNRVDIQNLFFPPSFVDASPTAFLQDGETRISTCLKVRIEFEAQVTLRIPTREESKDWKWKGKAGAGSLPANKKVARRQSNRVKRSPVSASTFETRPPGWLEMAVAPDSCITYETDLVASSRGYESKLNLEFKVPQMSTSVNHDLIWRSQALAVSCDLSTPLSWGGLRHWRFDVLGDNMEIFLLRDHVFLLTDLINDWTSGPQAAYHTFVPFTYSIKLRLPNYKILLYANDSNIIDDPSNIDEKNTVLSLCGPLGLIDVELPLIDYRPLRNRVKFGIDAQDIRVQMETPSWNTFKAFLKTPEVGSIKHAFIHGSYDFYSMTSPSFTDTLILHVDVEELFFKAHGFLVRRFMNLKDNYFGEDYHFQTLAEYQAKINKMNEPERIGTEEEFHSARLTNDLDVILAVKLDDTTLALPCNIYSDQNIIKVEFSTLELDLRFTNYYMDIEVVLSPLSLSRDVTKPGAEGFEDSALSTEMFIDGFRIAGHRLFGLPPPEPTYVCNWDLGVGSISGECSPKFLRELLSALQCIAYSFEDLENALPLVKPLIIHDLTFLRVKVDAIKVMVPIESTALLVETGSINLQYNDWANPQFSDHLQAHIVGIKIASIDTQSASRRRSGLESMTTHAYLETSLNVRLVSTKPDSERDRELQQKHIQNHDLRTKRVGWLLQRPLSEGEMQEPQSAYKLKAPAMPVPPMPPPLYKSSDRSAKNSQAPIPSSFRNRSSLHSKSSFLSDAARSFSRHPSESPARSANTFLRAPSVDIRLNRRSMSATLQDDSLSLASTKPRVSGFNNIGRSPSFRSQRGHVASNVLFTSPYQLPHFPLLNLTPDTRDVPTIDEPNVASKDSLEIIEPGEGFLASRNSAFQYAYVNVTFGSGVRVLLTPEGLRTFQTLALSQQPDAPASILDGLQIQAIKSAAAKRKHAPTSSTKIRVQVPSIAAAFIHRIEDDQDAHQRRHRYDFQLANLLSIVGLTNLNEAERAKNTNIGHRYLLHAVWKKLHLSAKVESQDDARGLANLGIALDKGEISLTADPGIAGDLAFQNLEVACINRRVTYLSSLLQTTKAHVDGLLRELQNSNMDQTRHIERFVLMLLDCKDPPRDPAFLTSASYVLRSAADHIRLSDSWKMILHLRQIQLSHPLLDGACKERDQVDGAGDLQSGKDLICQKFSEWRGWDLTDPHSSTLIHTIYGQVALPVGRTATPITDKVRFSVESQMIQILVNPGPQQNEVAITNLAVCFISTNSRILNSETHSEPTAIPRDHTLEVLVESSKARINWDIFQLVDDLNRQLIVSEEIDEIEPTRSSDVVSPSNLPSYHRCHIMLLSSTNTLDLASINLHYSSTAENFKSSLIIDYMTKRDLLMCTDLHVKQLTTNLFRGSQPLLTCHLLEPSVHVMFEQVPTASAEEGSITIAAFCKDLSLRTEQDIHGILALSDSIISDEVQHIETILQGFRKEKNLPHTSSKRETAVKDLWVLQTAFSLDTYQISVLLLPSLEYTIQGGLARSTIRPRRRHPAELLLDFDIEEHSQSLVSIANGNRQGVFTLLLPPVNGVFGLDNKSSRPMIKVDVVMETIVLDAASLYRAISASLQSDLLTLREGVLRDYETVKARFLSVVSPSESSKFPVTNFSPDKSPILFQARVAIAGLDILASTVKNDAESSHLHFHLACITASASNQDLENRRSLEFIEGSINLTKVELQMEHTVGATSFPSGDLVFTASFHIGSKMNGDNELVRNFESSVNNLQVDLYTGTASLLIDILAQLRQRLQKLDLSEEIRGVRARQRIRGRLKTLSNLGQTEDTPDEDDSLAIGLFTTMILFEVNNVQVSWNVGDQIPIKAAHEREDLVLSIAKIELATKRENAARLMFQDFQVQLVPVSQSKALRSANSALLPRVIFNVAYFSTQKERRLAFQSVGQSLDLRLTSNFILPASNVQRSVAIASQELRDVITSWNAPQFQSGGQMTNIIGSKRLSSFLVDADFAGAVVYIQSQAMADSLSHSVSGLRNGRSPQQGRYGQFAPESSGSSMEMRSPGIAWKIEYGNFGVEDPTLSAEIKIDASENTLHPAVVPLLVEMSSSVREVVGKPDDRQPLRDSKVSPPKSLAEDKLSNADPTAILGSCKLNVGLTICKQEFSLTCQPIARVAATAKFERINLAINTVQAEDSRFFTVFMACNHLNASVQHIYSRESTGTFEVDSISLSMMNSKHVSAADGISAIARFTPVRVSINAKQVHDFLLFREIWMPTETHAPNPESGVVGQTEPQTIIVQRYQQMAATGAFPWNASVSVAELNIGIDFGPILGKSTLSVSELWVCSKKSSDWDQSLCLGLDGISASSIGRMSGSAELTDLRVRTSIKWPTQGNVTGQTPVVEAASRFDELNIKAAFDYQAFLIANVTNFDFLMYNVRGNQEIDHGDRLVGVLNIDILQAFCTTSSAAQGLALYQAVERLIQEKQTAYMNSLREIEKHLRRKSSLTPLLARVAARQKENQRESQDTPIRLQTDVAVSIRAVNAGAFPGTFFDTQLFKLETVDTAAQFSVTLEKGKVHSSLGLQLGLLRIALSGVTKPALPKSFEEVSVAEVIQLAISSRGGTILKVPRVVADMQTWQAPASNEIDYIFRSSFEGKVEVGWNYSRISFIRGMWATHTRTLAHRLGKPLPQSAVQITGGPQPPGEGGSDKSAQEQEKITAVVNVPLSKYHYTALETPVIETPQLRDMGEATPPLEWIGLHRERLPNLTHQIVIVTLLEVAKEVEDAYTQILGA